LDRRYLVTGALPAFGAACCFACMAALVKVAATEASSQVLVFLRSAFGLIVITPFALRRGGEFLRTPRLGLHVTRAAFSIGALSCFYYAVSQIGLGEAILLNASSPLFIGVLAIFMLGERLESRAIIALALGFVGVVMLLKPGTSLFDFGAMIGASSALFVAFAKIFIRRMADTEPVLRTVFYFGVFSTVLSALPLLWLWQTPSAFAVGCMVLAALFATIGQTALTQAFTHNTAASVAPFSYVTVMLGGALGWVVWNERPDVLSVIGAGFVISGCLVMVLRARQSGPWRPGTPVPESR